MSTPQVDDVRTSIDVIRRPAKAKPGRPRGTRYTKQFKLDAVARVKEMGRGSARKVSEDLNVSYNTILAWVRRYGADTKKTASTEKKLAEAINKSENAELEAISLTAQLDDASDEIIRLQRKIKAIQDAAQSFASLVAKL